MREVDVALFRLALFAHHVDLVAGLEPRLALVVENFRQRQHALGLGTNIDDHMGRGELQYGAFDDVIVARSFFGFDGEIFKRGGKIFGCSRHGLWFLFGFLVWRGRGGRLCSPFGRCVLGR